MASLESPFGSGTATSSTGIKPMEAMVPKQPVNMFGVNTKALLYLIRPSGARALTDQAHRPNLFTFNNRFANKAAELIDKAVMQQGSNRALIDLTNTKDALTCIKPNASPDTIIKTSALSHNWQFILLVFENGGNGTASPLNKQRTIITGYFLDEPINPATLSNPKPTVNENATMVFTHRTVVGEMSTYGHDGLMRRDYRTHFDAHCIDPHQIKGLVGGQEMHLLDPKTCWDTNTYIGDGNSFSLPGVTSNIDNFNGPQAINASLDNPKSTVKDILTVVHNAHENLQMESRMGSSQNVSFLYPNASSETLRSMVTTNFENKYTMYGSGGPQENQVWHMRKLDQTYPNMDVQVVELENAYTFSAANQMDNTEHNMFSAMLCSVVPTVMVDMGLGTIAFTATVRMVPSLEERCFWNVSRREALMQLPDQELNIRARSVMTALINGVFESIRLLRGDFTVSAAFTLSGRSHVLINFLSDRQKNTVPYEVPTNLSGLITPTFGVPVAHGHNAQEMNNLMGILLGDQSVENSIGHVQNNGLLGNQGDFNIQPGGLLGSTNPMPNTPLGSGMGNVGTGGIPQQPNAGGLHSPFRNAGMTQNPNQNKNSGLSSPFGMGGINTLK